MPPSIQKMFLRRGALADRLRHRHRRDVFYEDEPNYLGVLATGLYVAFTLGNVVSRIVTIYTSIPGDDFYSAARSSAPLRRSSSSATTLDSAADVYLVLFFFFFALVGGVLIQIPFLLPKTKCAPEDVSARGALHQRAQGAGLTFGGLIDVAVAVGLIYASHIRPAVVPRLGVGNGRGGKRADGGPRRRRAVGRPFAAGPAASGWW